ncbi:Rho termination factor N-terminal domain-containing protein [uncultured Arsenicicoccus sp.]|uniref:Rho termination factor N-terminal domain-containing protein n=1 Tax=uncultured Arsenicicoccus sp. TaxID=491339 RepID=UPI0025932C2C|nr:Rho termination factor N-terminal domain-containing protein [uncultured Arsenicicoccus sp.]
MAPSEDASKDQRQDDPGPSVRDKELYETLRDEGNSKEKSARIANAAAAQGRSTVGARGGEHGSYDGWTKDELLDRAREVGIEGRSSMNKDELIDALREH